MPTAAPVFDRRIFWDLDYDRMDVDAKWRFGIERVFERGDVEDIRQCRRYYGDDKVRTAVLEAKFFPEGAMYLASAVIDVPVELFRSFELRRRMGHYLPY